MRSEQRLNALRQTCHTKIKGIQKNNAAHLQTLKVQLSLDNPCHGKVLVAMITKRETL